jgi:hypothetical protein
LEIGIGAFWSGGDRGQIVANGIFTLCPFLILPILLSAPTLIELFSAILKTPSAYSFFCFENRRS